MSIKLKTFLTQEVQVEYTIKSGFENMDFCKITEMLGTSFWSPGISMDEVIKGARNSALVVGTFDYHGRQNGYARVISDKTRFAYILDVFVDPLFRRQGIAHAMVEYIIKNPDLEDVYQWLLITQDAHAIYEKSGF